MKKLDDQREIVKNPTAEGLKTIFDALEIRKDNIHDIKSFGFHMGAGY